MDVLLNDLEDPSVPQPAGWIDITGALILGVLEALRIVSGKFSTRALMTHRVLTAEGELNDAALRDVATMLGVRFGPLLCVDGRVVRGEMFVRRFNRDHGPWYWRPGVAELALLWLQNNPDVAVFESDWLSQLHREAMRQRCFCRADLFELRTGVPMIVHEDHLRAFVLALYWACPHKGALPEPKFVLSPHAGDFYQFAQTLGVRIDGPSLEVEPGEETGEPVTPRAPLAPGLLWVYAGLYDFRYAPSGISRPLSYCVLDEFRQRLAAGCERPWDMTRLMRRLEDESAQAERQVTASLLYGNRLVGALTLAAGLMGPPVPGGAAIMVPLHIAAHTVVELAAVAGQRRRKDGEANGEESEDGGRSRVEDPNEREKVPA